MRKEIVMKIYLLVVATIVALALVVPAAQQQGAPRPTAPPGINWPSPPLPDGPVVLDTGIQHQIRLFVTKGLNQPWSMAFLPDGAILVTERPGRLRIIRNGVLDPHAIAGVPEVSTTGARGLQGLMDIVLHPRFAENHWIYLSYHKPVGDGGGATTLARATWTGTALTDVHDIFESGATDTEASRVAFGRDGMLYMTISGPGGGPDVIRAQDPNDYAGKVVRLREDGTVPPDNP